MPLGDNYNLKKSTPGTDKPLQKITPLEWKKANFDDKSGLNIGIIGEPKAGRSTLSLLFAYFNSQYKDLIKEGGYDYALQGLNEGILPEIEQIIILEPEAKLEKALQKGGVRKALILPFKDKLDIIPFPIERKEIALTEDGYSVKQNREYFETRKQEFIETLKAIIDHFGENTLFIIDTLSHFKKLLDDKFGLLYDVMSKRENPIQEGVDTFRQSYYASRNTSWDNVMGLKQGFKGWNVDVFKEKPIPTHYQQTGEDPYTIKWIDGTMHYLNMAYRVYKKADGSREIEMYEGEYMPKDSKEFYLKYPQEDKMGAMPIINALCKEIILGEKRVK